jgi:hypothetical protein
MKRGIWLIAALLWPQPAGAKPVSVKHDSKALDFTYAWPSEAAAIPALDRRFRADMANAYRKALSGAREDQKIYREQGREDIGDLYSMTWTTAGETPRLLSLQNELSTFTGGAHPNTSYGALLWDRKLNREVATDALFRRPAEFGAVTRPAYCKALHAERNQRREGEKLDLPEFNACPKASELAISPVDSNGNGRFDRIAFVASPYTAGPYAEGEYDISVPVTARLVTALKPEYRGSFEAQRQ